MGKWSRWASVIYPLKKSKWGCCCLPPDRVKLIVKSKKETNIRVKMSKESKWAKSQNGPRVKMDFCCLPPDRVKLAVNSKKETNSRVKMGKESKWAKGQDQLLFLSRVKMGKELKWAKGQRWASVVYPLTE